LGLVYHHLGDYVQAQRSFERALALNPEYVEAALNLAIVCNDLGQHERARDLYQAAVAQAARGRAPRDGSGDEPLDAWSKAKIANLHAAVAEGYASVRRPRDAAVEYRKALQLCPQFVDLRLKLAQCLTDAGQRAEALAEHRAAAESAPAFLPARVALGISLYASGRVDEAAAEWEEVLRIDPGHRAAAMYLKLARSRALGAARAGPREVGS
jgi:tetratricopeptide (TPR) repeat protein